MSKLRLPIAFTAIVVTIGLPTFFVSRDLRRAAILQPFQERVVDWSAPPCKKAAGRAALPGKVVPIDVDAGRVDALLFRLPSRLRPEHPDQVAAVLLLEWRPVRVGLGSDGRTRYRYDCQVSLVDARTRALLIDRRLLRGRLDERVVPAGPIIGLLEALPEL